MYSFGSTLTLNNITMEKIEIATSLILIINTQFFTDNWIIHNITTDIDQASKIIEIHTDSNAIINNVRIEDIRLGVVSLTDSTLEIYNSYIGDVTAIDSIFDVYTSKDMVFDNLTTFNCVTDNRRATIAFRSSTIDMMRNCYFQESQLNVMEMRNTNVTVFTNNTLDGINRGLKIYQNSNVKISNSMFKNMVQNIRQEDLYVSDIIDTGSGLGKSYKIIVV